MRRFLWAVTRLAARLAVALFVAVALLFMAAAWLLSDVTWPWDPTPTVVQP